MAPRFDPDRLRLTLSVADLLDRQLARSIGFANRGGYERMWLGQAIHSRYQEEALREDPTYRREVVLTHTFIHRGWEVTVSGRADGLRRDHDGAQVVEEIKSVRRGGHLAPAVAELYQQQTQLYVWMLAAQQAAEAMALSATTAETLRETDPESESETTEAGSSEAGPSAAESSEPESSAIEPDPTPGAEGVPRPTLNPIRAELILIEIGSDAITRLAVDVEPRHVEGAVKRRLNSLLRAFEAERREAATRKEFAERLVFPYEEMRPGQGQIVERVTQALDQREHLLLQATTGIGKTVAALYPALRYCLEHGKRLFVLTAKTLQQDMATAVLSLLNEESAFRALRLRAKAKMCANDQLICHEEYCPFAKDYAQKLHATQLLSGLIRTLPILDPDSIFQAARDAEVCPFEVSLELTGQVQATVCDYNYAFAPYVALSEFGTDNDLSDIVLVIDEIHNLVGRGRDYYSPELSSVRALRAAEAIAQGGEPIHFQLQGLCLKLVTLIEEAVDDALDIPSGEALGQKSAQNRAVETTMPEERLWRLRPQLDTAFVDYLEHRRATKSFRADDEFVELYFEVLRFLNGLVVTDSSFSHLAERAGRDRRLKILCKDPSRFLGSIINRTHTTVGLSATLSPPEFYQDLLGFDSERTDFLSIPNPFPEENRRVVIDSGVATVYKKRPENYPVIARRLADFADRVPGNCLALFPSYAFLAQVAGMMPDCGKRVLVQERISSDKQREAILETLRSAVLGDVLLLAVAGGVFAEGVDYPGEMLRAVAVIGPCLPGLSTEQELLKQYYDERFERGFEYAYVVPGMTRVVQAAGRLIRSPDDSGVIALLDQRFLARPYRDHLPPDWLPDEGAGALAGHPADAAGEFFEID